ncbi:MAG TPA: arginine deiminase-related protein [Xanthobacteraceae bacterium]|nr:arginine deiminase-related protein [Xanthobacteraceae bacterium]
MNVHATLAETGTRPRLLMCPPRHFAVTYRINPWMDPRSWAGDGRLHAEAERQWTALRDALIAAGAAVETIEPIADLPDLVFTANAAVVLDRKAVLSRFRHPERRNEEPIFAARFAALAERGVLDEVSPIPDGIILEGAGDCIWDSRRRLFWLGCGFRSDTSAAAFLERQLGHRCLPLPLADACFYHLDTALCALPCGSVIYYPGAFTPAARATIDAHVAPEHRIALDRADAERFAANVVCIGNTIVLSSCGGSLRTMLNERGYAVVETPLHAFLRSGGSACCLTLRLDHRSEAFGRVDEQTGNRIGEVRADAQRRSS